MAVHSHSTQPAAVVVVVVVVVVIIMITVITTIITILVAVAVVMVIAIIDASQLNMDQVIHSRCLVQLGNPKHTPPEVMP